MCLVDFGDYPRLMIEAWLDGSVYTVGCRVLSSQCIGIATWL